MLAREPDLEKVRGLHARYGLEVRKGDVTEAQSLRGTLEDMEAVIHLVGIISEIGRGTFENVHTEGTRNMVAATNEQGVKRFVHMSALGTRPNAVSRYHKSKWAAEETVRSSGLDWTIFRPSLIYGPGDQFVNLFAKIIRWSPVVPVMGRRDARFQPVAVENVAEAFVKAVQEPRAFTKTFDLCGTERLTLIEIIDQIMSVMGKRRLKAQVPTLVARIQAGFLEFLFPRVLRKAPPLNRDQLIMLEEDNVGDEQAAKQLFGLAPAPLRERIRYLREE